MKTYKVTVSDFSGTITWYNEQSQIHREDGPAVEFSNGEKGGVKMENDIAKMVLLLNFQIEKKGSI